LVGLINALTAPFRRQTSGQPRRDPSGGPIAAKGGAPIMSYSWGQNAGGFNTGNNLEMTRFAPVFQPSGGLFAPSYPVVPVEPERTRRWNFPVGYNLTYTPRSFEPVGFAELRALAQHDITRLAIETRKDQIEKLEWTIKPRDEKNAKKDAPKRIDELIDFWSSPDGMRPFATWVREAPRRSPGDRRSGARTAVQPRWRSDRPRRHRWRDDQGADRRHRADAAAAGASL